MADDESQSGPSVSPALTTVHSPAGYRVISAQEAEERFRVSADVGYPYADFADEQEIRLYEGGLHVTGHLEPEQDDDDWVPYNTIVDGDLTVDGDLDWWDGLEGNFFLVTGVLRARNVLLSGCPDLVVRGDLEVTCGVCVSDEGMRRLAHGVRPHSRPDHHQHVVLRHDFRRAAAGTAPRRPL